MAFQGAEAEIAAMGGHFTSSNTRELTSFSAVVTPDKVNQAIKVLAGAVKGTNSSAEGVAAAKGAVQCTLEGAHQSPVNYLYEHLHDAAFLDQPMGLFSLGTPQSVDGLQADAVSHNRAYCTMSPWQTFHSLYSFAPCDFFHLPFLCLPMSEHHDLAHYFFIFVFASPANTRAESNASIMQVESFRKSNFAANKIVLSAAGAVNHEAVAASLDHELSGIPATATSQEAVEAGHFRGSDKRMRFDSYPLAHIALAFKSAPKGSEYSLPLQVMQEIMGSWDNSGIVGPTAACRFAQNCYSLGITKAETFNFQYSDTGLWGVHGVATDNKLNDFMYYALDNLLRMVHHSEDEQVDRAKLSLKTKLLLSTQGAAAATADMTQQITSQGRCLHPTEVFARLDDLDTKSVKACAEKFINDECHALAAIGPIYELPDYNWIRRRSYWLRY
ncbi:unnamed protein product [Chrysoparadoxa australica]